MRLCLCVLICLQAMSRSIRCRVITQTPPILVTF